MLSVRTTKTQSFSTAVQVVRYVNRKTVIVKHIGSAKTKDDIYLLKMQVWEYIQQITGQIPLFDLKDSKYSSKSIQIDKSKYLGIRYSFIYEKINQIFNLFKFDKLNNTSLLDFVLMRIIEPTSKLQSLELLNKYFGISYQRSEIYRNMQTASSIKEKVEKMVIDFAKENFNFTIVFYDVTTLYFETFKDDILRKFGFSKDNKFNQPQILIGLIVNSDGFPISFEIFAGNKFEGHTLIPSIISFKNKYNIKGLTVVADAAMINFENIKELTRHKLNYIVGAKVGSLSLKLIKEISGKLGRIDRKSIRKKSVYGYLICDFSLKRYRKDKFEMEKQIKKALINLNNIPSLLKRSKFIKSDGNTKYELNKELIEKTKLLLGIKGYCTNLSKMNNQKIINYYRALWQIEKSFRIAKSDLKIRPIYHYKIEAIKSHVLICFMALCVAKFMEIKTNKSNQKIIKLLKNVTDATILDLINNKKVVFRSEINDETKQILKKMGLSY